MLIMNKNFLEEYIQGPDFQSIMGGLLEDCERGKSPLEDVSKSPDDRITNITHADIDPYKQFLEGPNFKKIWLEFLEKCYDGEPVSLPDEEVYGREDMAIATELIPQSIPNLISKKHFKRVAFITYELFKLTFPKCLSIAYRDFIDIISGTFKSSYRIEYSKFETLRNTILFLYSVTFYSMLDYYSLKNVNIKELLINIFPGDKSFFQDLIPGIEELLHIQEKLVNEVKAINYVEIQSQFNTLNSSLKKLNTLYKTNDNIVRVIQDLSASIVSLRFPKEQRVNKSSVV